MGLFVNSIIEGCNNPPEGCATFDSSDHVRFQDGEPVTGHNFGCHRRLSVEKNIQGEDGYTITIYNLDGVHPFWQDNLQMAPKRMKIINVDHNIVEFRGYGYDENAVALGASLDDASYANYGIVLLIENSEIIRAQLNMYDRNISIVYLK